MRNPWFISFPFLPYSGMALFPFIVVKHNELKQNQTLVYHERIHLKQQAELLVIPFYIVYVLNYLVNLLRFRNHDKAYRSIIFEKEAYQNESVYHYIRDRKFCAFLKYI